MKMPRGHVALSAYSHGKILHAGEPRSVKLEIRRSDVLVLCQRSPASPSLPSGSTWSLWSESGHPARSLKRVFATIWLDYHFRIQLFFLRNWASSEVVLVFTTGYRKPIYSQPTVRARIALRSIRKRSGSTTSSTGCTLLSIHRRTESFTHGCLRRIRSRSRENFSLN
jgi:hypothetical protein